MRIDAHCHTDCSDGCVSIEQRMKMIVDCGYHAGTITDHDYISRAQVSLAQLCNRELFFIPGIELTTCYKEKTVHILGYFVNPENEELQKHIKELDNREHSMVKKMLKVLHSDFSIDIKEEDLEVPSLHICYYLRLIKLVSRNCGFYFPRTQECYYGALDKLGYTWNSFFDCSVQKAINLIHDANGIAVLAHPGFEADQSMDVLGFQSHDFELIQKYKSWGLDGVETHCPSHSSRQNEQFLVWARALDLLSTEGSDCHGNDPSLGSSLMDKFHPNDSNGVEHLLERLELVQGRNRAIEFEKFLH